MKELDIGGLLVREDGLVKNISGHHIGRGRPTKKGWHTGSISNGYRIVGVPGKGLKRVHRLVAKAFISNPENKPFVNHINGVKNDNRVENLEWCTCQENTQHAYDTGLKKKGKDHYSTKLTVEDCIEIKQHLSEGKLSQTKIGELYGVTHVTISNINKGKHWSCNK